MMMNQDMENLARECRFLTHYLAGRSPSDDLVQRYLEAHRVLLSGPHEASEMAMAAFVHRHPWTLPYLDAASGLLRPHSLLRKKILLMIALLEASPEFTEFFVPEAMSVSRFLWHMTGYGLSSAAKLAVGCLIYPVSILGR